MARTRRSFGAEFKTQVVLDIISGSKYPKAVVCRVLNVARSSLYRRSSVVSDEALNAATNDIFAQFPCYGYRRVTAELRKQGW